MVRHEMACPSAALADTTTESAFAAALKLLDRAQGRAYAGMTCPSVAGVGCTAAKNTPLTAASSGVGGYRKQIRQQDDPHGEAHVALHLSYVSPPIRISTGHQAPLSIRPGNRADLSSKAVIAHRILSDNEELKGDAVGEMFS